MPRGDEDVLGGVIEPERFHRPHLRPDDLGISGRSHVQVEVFAAAEGAEGHSTIPVDETYANGAVNRHCFLEGCLNVHTPAFLALFDWPLSR